MCVCVCDNVTEIDVYLFRVVLFSVFEFEIFPEQRHTQTRLKIIKLNIPVNLINFSIVGAFRLDFGIIFHLNKKCSYF